MVMNDWTKAADRLPEAGIPVCFELLVNPGVSALPMQGRFDGDYFVALDGAKKSHSKFAPRLVARWRHASKSA